MAYTFISAGELNRVFAETILIGHSLSQHFFSLLESSSYLLVRYVELWSQKNPFDRFSQRWLLEVNRDEEALEVVYQLHGSSTEESKKAANKEYKEMHDNIKAELLVRSRHISDLWATNAMIRRTLVAAGVQIFGQFTGINGQHDCDLPFLLLSKWSEIDWISFGSYLHANIKQI